MKTNKTYLDYNAGAPLRKEALAAMSDLWSSVGNASSIHSSGRNARSVIESARESVAALFDALPANVVFTSGGTESNVTALSPVWLQDGVPFSVDRLFVSAVEHPSVLAGGRFSPDKVHKINVDDCGRVDLGDLAQQLAGIPYGEKALVSVMAANSETGVLQPIKEIGVVVEDAGHLFHVDAVQAAGRMDLSIAMMGCQALSVSSHKLGGPQGVGALVLAKGSVRPAPLMTGGGQESWRRAGTENTAGIAGFAAAAEASLNVDERARLARMQQQLESQLKSQYSDLLIFGCEAPRLANTTCFAVEGVPAETALISFDLSGVAVSSGSACSSGKVGVSHVLTAMGVDEPTARGAIRVSMGWGTREDDVNAFLKAWKRIYDRMSPQKKKERAV
ncbi:cysteine desulfurase family protein [Pseudovibrio exalbescens]|uniref:Cysteine desulfurase n=1 Tax=Pseudovibrio exalbescens TaxID=197461 RepID=A0A1U7JDX3_9HYPH|nr:cysteine desulfurase family protein [Pseudovibrio exalbescens]OKL42956.1 cysteine desulfurase [Pseudovibrio exalbescens]